MILQPPTTVKFDPSIKLHRISVHKFMKRWAWSDSPLKFSHDPDYSNVVEQVQTKLLEWYLERDVNGTKS